MFSILDH